MKKVYFAIPVLAGMLLSGCSASREVISRQEKLEKQLEQLSSQLDKLEKESEKSNSFAEMKTALLEKELKAAEEKLKFSMDIRDVVAAGHDAYGIVGVRYLELISPPANPTPQQIRRFLADLAVIRNISSQRLSERVTPRLVGFGPEYLPEMLPHASYNLFSPAVTQLLDCADMNLLKNMVLSLSPENGRHAAVNVFVRRATSADKEFILANFTAIPELLSLVQKIDLGKGAAEKVRSYMLSGTGNSNYYLAQALDAAVKDMPEAEREKFFDELWKRFVLPDMAGGGMDRSGFRSNIRRYHGGGSGYGMSLASKMVKYGYLPAFKLLADNYDGFLEGNREYIGILLSKVSRESADDFKNWYVKNKDRIVFDRKSGWFVAGNSGVPVEK